MHEVHGTINSSHITLLTENSLMIAFWNHSLPRFQFISLKLISDTNAPDMHHDLYFPWKERLAPKLDVSTSTLYEKCAKKCSYIQRSLLEQSD